MKIDPTAVYTVETVGELAGVKAGAVRKWIADGKLKAAKPGKRYLILGSVLLAFLGEPAPAPSAEPVPAGVPAPVSEKGTVKGREGVRVRKQGKGKQAAGSMVPRVIGL